jgi:hypothetical protein
VSTSPQKSAKSTVQVPSAPQPQGFCMPPGSHC